MAFWFFIIVVALYVAAAGFSDFRMQRIPNYLTVPMAIGGLVCSLLPEWALPGYPTTLPNCLLGLGLGFAIFLLPFLLGPGAGDLKLVAALGAWLGWLYLLFALAISLSFAMVLAFVVWTINLSASSKKSTKPIPLGVNVKNGKTARPKTRRRTAVPFAIPLALGTWCILGGMVLENRHPELFQPPSRSASLDQTR